MDAPQPPRQLADKYIRRAACLAQRKSTLFAVLLLVVLLSPLARAEAGQPEPLNPTQIIVALIGCVGLVGAAAVGIRWRRWEERLGKLDTTLWDRQTRLEATLWDRLDRLEKTLRDRLEDVEKLQRLMANTYVDRVKANTYVDRVVKRDIQSWPRRPPPKSTRVA